MIFLTLFFFECLLLSHIFQTQHQISDILTNIYISLFINSILHFAISARCLFLKKTAADNMRGLKQELLKLQLIVDYFVPEDVAVSIKDKATWDEDNATYILPRTGLMGNNLRGRRPISAANSRRPETEYARRRKAYVTKKSKKFEDLSVFGQCFWTVFLDSVFGHLHLY